MVPVIKHTKPGIHERNGSCVTILTETQAYFTS